MEQPLSSALTAYMPSRIVGSPAKLLHKFQRSTRDQISTLPDEILIYILSLLTLKEAAITSLLSTRWRNLWTFVVNLNFDAEMKMGIGKDGKKARRRRRLRFTKWVNGVLQLHQGGNIGKFRIFCDLIKMDAYHIDAWISFALAKKVENLELNLSEDCMPDLKSRLYTFPCYLFAGETASSVKHLSLRACIFCPPPGSDCFESLKTLSLKDVDVTEDTINNILSYCSLLEHLCVEGSENLVSLKVKGASRRLKHLEVYYCDNLENIEIYTTNLVSLKYYGPKISLSLKCGLQLVNLYCGVYYYDCKDRMSYVVSKYQSCLSQLKTLTLELNPMEVDVSSKILHKFCNLKVLVLWVGSSNVSFTPFISLLKASPLLHRFEMHCMYRLRCICPPRMNCVLDCVLEDTHQFLKEVELSGFRGYAEDMELATYIFSFAVALEKFTIDPYDYSLIGNKWSRTKSKGISVARECGKMLLSKKPPNVVMTIL